MNHLKISNLCFSSEIQNSRFHRVVLPLGDSSALDASSGTYHPHGSPGFWSVSTAKLLLDLPGAKSLDYLGVIPLLQFIRVLPGAARSNMALCFVNGSAAYDSIPSLT